MNGKENGNSWQNQVRSRHSIIEGSSLFLFAKLHTMQTDLNKWRNHAFYHLFKKCMVKKRCTFCPNTAKNVLYFHILSIKSTF